jgi:hypothetical protein
MYIFALRYAQENLGVKKGLGSHEKSLEMPHYKLCPRKKKIYIEPNFLLQT